MINAPQTSTRQQLLDQQAAERLRRIASHLADAADLRDLADAAEAAGMTDRAAKLRRQAKGHQSAAARISG